MRFSETAHGHSALNMLALALMASNVANVIAAPAPGADDANLEGRDEVASTVLDKRQFEFDLVCTNYQESCEGPVFGYHCIGNTMHWTQYNYACSLYCRCVVVGGCPNPRACSKEGEGQGANNGTETATIDPPAA